MFDVFFSVSLHMNGCVLDQSSIYLDYRMLKYILFLETGKANVKSETATRKGTA